MSRRSTRVRKPVKHLVIDPESIQYETEDYVLDLEEEDIKDPEDSYELSEETETDSDLSATDTCSSDELDDACFSEFDESEGSDFEYLDRVTQECSESEDGLTDISDSDEGSEVDLDLDE